MFQRFNAQAKAAIERAWQLAARAGRERVEPEDLLAGLIEDGESSFCGLLEHFAVELHSVAGRVGAHGQAAGARSGAEAVFSPAARRVMEYAVEEADRLGHERIGTSHFLLALLREAHERAGGTRVLLEHGLDVERVRARLRRRAGGGRDGGADAVPALLFFELDARARAEEAKLRERCERLEERLVVLQANHEVVLRRLEALEALLRSAAAIRSDPLREG